MELIWMIPGYTNFAMVYTLLGIVTAIACNRESLKKNYAPFEWVAMGFVFPVVTYLVMKSKKYNSSKA
ncbi:MAG: hypothetical protein WC044_04135 [Crocinitomicaceae bacterium]